MKQRIGILFMIICLLGSISLGEQTLQTVKADTSAESSSELIAGEGERAPQQEVGEDGLEPVYGDQLKDGVYSIEVDSSSSMFRIVDAVLTVEQGTMNAVITLGGTGYLKLYMGTGEQAVTVSESEYASFVEDDQGRYTYSVPVAALNQELECTGFSKRKEKWYDHQILFEADTLPEGALLLPEAIEGAEVELTDGTYQIEVDLEGGTGRASIESPTELRVKDNRATAVITWSSSNYDFMKIGSTIFKPVNTEGNSVFEIPVTTFDEPMPVIGNTTAMGSSHEIEYTLLFHLDSVNQEADSASNWLIPVCVIAVVVVGGCIYFLMRKKRKNEN